MTEDEWIEKVLAEAPPLSPAQKDRLVRLLTVEEPDDGQGPLREAVRWYHEQQ